MSDAYRLPNGQIIDAGCLAGTVDPDAPLPTWQDYQDWLAAMSKPAHGVATPLKDQS